MQRTFHTEDGQERVRRYTPEQLRALPPVDLMDLTGLLEARKLYGSLKGHRLLQVCEVRAVSRQQLLRVGGDDVVG